MRIVAPAPKSPFETSLPLINIVFLLLLFFLAAGTIVSRQDLTVTPPTSLLLAGGKPPADGIYVSAVGVLTFRGQSLDAEGIAEAIRTEVTSETAAEIALRPWQLVADRRLKARRLLSIVAELKQHGVHNLAVVTVKDEGS
jgi:biopolymer transport protein ExbD